MIAEGRLEICVDLTVQSMTDFECVALILVVLLLHKLSLGTMSQ